MSTIFFVGGGSVGHIAPSVAVWNKCRTLRTDVQAHFICSTKPADRRFLQSNDLPHSSIAAPRISLDFFSQWKKAIRQTERLFQKYKPCVIFSKGGYVSVPVCYVAWRRNIPIILHESDAVSGYANRLVGIIATHICYGFPSRKTHATSPHRTYTGNPVREEITQGERIRGLDLTGLKGNRPILLVMGGSQGAKALNDIIAELLDDILIRCDVIHITGRGKNLIREEREGYFATEFATDDLPQYYACADFALSRAGASSIAELAMNNIPTILVPLRGVGHDHQEKNALEVEGRGCIRLEQTAMTEDAISTIHHLTADAEKRAQMSNDIHLLATPDAALHIARIIVMALDSTHSDG